MRRLRACEATGCRRAREGRPVSCNREEMTNDVRKARAAARCVLGNQDHAIRIPRRRSDRRRRYFVTGRCFLIKQQNPPRRYRPERRKRVQRFFLSPLSMSRDECDNEFRLLFFFSYESVGRPLRTRIPRHGREPAVIRERGTSSLLKIRRPRTDEFLGDECDIFLKFDGTFDFLYSLRDHY